MALVSMWPPTDGSRNSISFDGRAYSSVPGTSIQILDFDVPKLQANGWTTYATVAGQNYVPVTSPSSGLRNNVSFNNRSYFALPGTVVEAPPFDALILEANSWTQVFSITLQTLSLNASTFTSGAPHGTFIGNILRTTSGSTVAIFAQSNAGALQVANVGGTWQLQVGPTPPTGANSLTVTLQETHSGATNSPNTTGPLTVIENAVASANTLDWSNTANSGILSWLEAA